MTRTNRNAFACALLAAVTLTGALAVGAAAPDQSASTVYSRAYLHSFNLDSTGLALEGYCPVTYFTHNEARPGSPAFASTYNDVDYHFASADAKRAFDRDPQRYIPAYGGWCAYGMAVENKFPIDPTNFKIVDGRLFVFLRNRNVDALERWNQNDEHKQVQRADAYWKQVAG